MQTDQVGALPEQDIVELYLAGETAAEIGVRFGVTKAPILAVLRASGTPRRRPGPRPKHPPVEARVCELESCATIFTPTRYEAARGRRFCSRECADAGKRVLPVPEPRQCENCGTTFLPRADQAARGDGRFCKLQCKGEASQVRPQPGERTCARPGCENRFTPTAWLAANGQGECCSDSCAARERWRTGKVSTNVISLARSPRARQRWLGRWAGKEGATGGREGGRPAIATVEQSSEIFRLAREQKLSSRRIAAEVFGDARFYKRVQRILGGPRGAPGS